MRKLKIFKNGCILHINMDIYNINNWFNHYSQSQDITNKTNALIKKSRKIRNDIKSMKIDDISAKCIFSKIIDDTYEFNNLHNICVLSQLVNDNILIYDRWGSIDMLLNAYAEEFNTDNDMFNILDDIFTNYKHVFNVHEIYALDVIIKSFRNNGGHLNESDEQFIELHLMTDKIDKYVNIINKHINDGNVVEFSSVEELEALKNDKIASKLIVSKNSLKLNKKIYENISHNNNVNSDAKLCLFSLYNRYIIDVYPVLFNLILLRAKLAKFKGFCNYSEFSTKNCTNKNCNDNFNIIKKIIFMLDNDVATEINSTNSSTNVSKFMAHTKHSLTKRINSMKNISVDNMVQNVVNIMSKLYRLKFSRNNKCSRWDKNVIIFDIIDEQNDILMGHIYVDVKSKINDTISTNNVNCIELFTHANYPYGTDKHNLPISCVIANYNSQISYFDVILFTRELNNALYCICGKNDINILNGITMRDDYVNLFGVIIEQYMWESTTIAQFVDNNETVINLIKKLNSIDNAISLKRRCVYALFDYFIHSSDNFLQLCTSMLKQKDTSKLIDVFIKFYDSIVGQVMNKNVDNLSREFNDSIILSCINDNSGKKCSILVAEIIAKKFYSQNKSGDIFFMMRTNIMNTYDANVNFEFNNIQTIISQNNNPCDDIKITKNKNKNKNQNKLLFVKK